MRRFFPLSDGPAAWRCVRLGFPGRWPALPDGLWLNAHTAALFACVFDLPGGCRLPLPDGPDRLLLAKYIQLRLRLFFDHTIKVTDGDPGSLCLAGCSAVCTLPLFDVYTLDNGPASSFFIIFLHKSIPAQGYTRRCGSLLPLESYHILPSFTTEWKKRYTIMIFGRIFPAGGNTDISLLQPILLPSA